MAAGAQAVPACAREAGESASATGMEGSSVVGKALGVAGNGGAWELKQEAWGVAWVVPCLCVQ